MKKNLITLFLVIIFFSGCATHISGSRYPDLGPKLTKLTKAVDNKVYFDPECTGKMTEQEILYYSIAHDLELLEPFLKMTIHILRQGRNAIVLICSEDGTTAFFEDAGCTAELDWSWKEQDPPRPCEFTLKVCEKKI